MGWNVLFMLHLLCAMAAMAGVHSQGNAPDSLTEPQNQAFEGDAVHSMMRSWLHAGTSADLFRNSSWGWDLVGHPCNNSGDSWLGIYCSSTYFQPEDGNWVQYNILVSLILYHDDGLVGELPPAISNLTNLRFLMIRNARKLSGPLPARLFCSESLRTIILSNCSVDGSISSGFGSGSDCTNHALEYLDLSGNSFTEMIPTSTDDDSVIGFFNLRHLNVSNNRIKGEFVTRADNLETLDISNNFITSIIGSGEISELSRALKSIYAQNNSITTFPIVFSDYEALQQIYLDSNNISSIVQVFPNTTVSTIRRISMSKNKFQLFPEELLQLPNLEEIILDSNKITGDLSMPNISCHNSKIKLISLLNNNINGFHPYSDPTSCFSESSILLDAKVFLYGNPICTSHGPKSKLLRYVCRMNATSPIEDDELHTPKKSYKILIISVACASGVVVVLFIMGFFVIQKLKKKISLLHEIQSEFDKRDVKPNLYSFSELKVATQDFHIRNELGRGGFGVVYKGVLRDGSHVAVKKLTKLSMEQGIQDILSEIIVVSNIKHRNLVQLKGCCIKENQRILVHEFVENKNLVDALWGDPRSNKHLDWPTRFNIILGIARGLVYLHEDVEPAIVHRDIKGENILLDKHCNPKIADFGLAFFFPSFDDGITHMSVSTIAGTR